MLAQIVYDTENTARVASKMVADGKFSLDYVLKMPYTLIEEV